MAAAAHLPPMLALLVLDFASMAIAPGDDSSMRKGTAIP
jgi:hypothetical protein